MSDRITSEQVRRWSLTIVEERRLADQMDADADQMRADAALIIKLETRVEALKDQCLSRQNAHSILSRQYENELQRVAEKDATIQRLENDLVLAEQREQAMFECGLANQQRAEKAEAALAEKDATIRELQATLALYQSSNKVVFSFDYYMDLLAALDADESSYLVSNALRFKSRVAEMEAELAEKDATIAEMRAAGLRRILADSKEQP